MPWHRSPGRRNKSPRNSARAITWPRRNSPPATSAKAEENYRLALELDPKSAAAEARHGAGAGARRQTGGRGAAFPPGGAARRRTIGDATPGTGGSVREEPPHGRCHGHLPPISRKPRRPGASGRVAARKPAIRRRHRPPGSRVPKIAHRGPTAWPWPWHTRAPAA